MLCVHVWMVGVSCCQVHVYVLAIFEVGVWVCGCVCGAIGHDQTHTRGPEGLQTAGHQHGEDEGASQLHRHTGERVADKKVIRDPQEQSAGFGCKLPRMPLPPLCIDAPSISMPLPLCIVIVMRCNCSVLWHRTWTPLKGCLSKMDRCS